MQVRRLLSLYPFITALRRVSNTMGFVGGSCACCHCALSNGACPARGPPRAANGHSHAKGAANPETCMAPAGEARVGWEDGDRGGWLDW